MFEFLWKIVIADHFHEFFDPAGLIHDEGWHEPDWSDLDGEDGE